MGMEISAKMIYGANYKDLKSIVEDLDEMIDNDDLDYASPYYDSGRDEWVVGIEMRTAYEAEEEFRRDMVRAAKKFHYFTGCTGKVYIRPHVY